MMEKVHKQNAAERGEVVFIDDDPRAGELFTRFCRHEVFDVVVFREPLQALEYIRGHSPSLVISDLKMPTMTGIELLKAVREHDQTMPFIIVTAYSTVEDAVEALRLGATDFLKKPYDIDELLAKVNSKLIPQGVGGDALKASDNARAFGMVGDSKPIQEIFEIIDRIADIRVNVIIEGESGTGKELVASAIHNQSQFRDTPFLVVDCGALTDTLLESELFGHEKGAFTGASQAKRGLLEVASGGTLFLDEIGNISDSMQMKLLRVVQEQQVTRVGGVMPIDIDVRFVTATNRSLEEMVKQGEFRHDLFHRLNVVKIHVPPLRQRRQDVPKLIEHFLRLYAERYKRDVQGFDAESLEQMHNYHWPGNIRELKNLVERHVALATRPMLSLQQPLSGTLPIVTPTGMMQSIDHDNPSLQELEKRYIFKVLERMGGNKEKTAEVLGINKSTLWRKMQQYQSDGEKI